jgi:hypothetical protein
VPGRPTAGPSRPATTNQARTAHSSRHDRPMTTGSAPARRNAQPSGGAPHGPLSKRRIPAERERPTADGAHPGDRAQGDGAASRSRLHGRCRTTATARPPDATRSMRTTPAIRKQSSEPSGHGGRPATASHDDERGTTAATTASSSPRPNTSPQGRPRARWRRAAASSGSSPVAPARRAPRPTRPAEQQQHPRRRGVDEQPAPRPARRARCRGPGSRGRRRSWPRWPGRSRWAGPGARPRRRRRAPSPR